MLSLCQDCLKVHDFTPEQVQQAEETNQDGNRLCDCGGDVCQCDNCQDQAAIRLLPVPA